MDKIHELEGIEKGHNVIALKRFLSLAYAHAPRSEYPIVLHMHSLE